MTEDDPSGELSVDPLDKEGEIVADNIDKGSVIIEANRGLLISKLVLDLLHQLNPQYSVDQLSKFYASGGAALEGSGDVRSLERFYLQNIDARVPAKAVVLNGQNPSSVVRDSNKNLIYISSHNYNRHNLQFPAYVRRGIRNVPVDPPDVLLGGISLVPSIVDRFVAGGISRRVTLGGCSNLILSGNALGYLSNITGIDLSCEGDCYIGPNASVIEQEKCHVMLDAGRDVIQDERSSLRISDISCRNFIQKGGQLLSPPVRPNSIVICRGEFKSSDRTKPHKKVKVLEHSYR